MRKALTLEQFIARSKRIHGENKFTYEKTVYVNAQAPTLITCPLHGDITISPNNHFYAKSGCHKCNAPTSLQKKKFNQDFFLRRAIETHGKKYDYSKAVYKTSMVKVTIICPVHGEFQQHPHNHWNGSGCRACTWLNKRIAKY